MEDEGNAPSVYGNNGKIVYRASALGGCLVALAAARQELERAEWKEQHTHAFKLGNEAEDKFNTDNPGFLADKQKRVEIHIIGNIYVVGHMDGVYMGHPADIKRQTDDEWDKWTVDSWDTDPLWRKYSWQITSYMLGTGKLLGYMIRIRGDGRWNIEKVGILHSKAEVVARVLEVESLALDDVLTCKESNFFCQYPQLHQGPEPTDDPELEKLVDKYLYYKTQANSAKAGQTEVTERIKKHLDTTASTKVLLMSGRQVTKSLIPATKEHMVKGSKGYTRITVTDI